MDEVLHVFERRWFQLWMYGVGHSEVLLRSVKDDPDTLALLDHAPPGGYHHPTRVDVLFYGVSALHLQGVDFHAHLVISRAGDPEAVLKQAGLPVSALQGERHVFVLASGQGRSYVVASSVQSGQDDGAFFDPSPCRPVRP